MKYILRVFKIFYDMNKIMCFENADYYKCH